MLFNSFDFAIFLPIVFIIYWFLKKYGTVYQNVLLLIASYVFYGWWDWRFLSLILFSTLVDFIVGINLQKANSKLSRKLLLLVSISVNIGFLGFFKYYNFFLENFIEAFSLLGYQFTASSLKIVLPVGISFYTFQTLSYSIDVYRRKLKPTNNFIAFASFVSFFPQLVAGPIERATNLLPQFLKERKFNYSDAVDGMRQILWGFFKKLVIADNAAEMVNYIFAHNETLGGSTLLLGGVLFAFQIYGDFSGYSDIAIGTAKLFGFNLMQNFAFPYFSRDIAEFWRRWHISLSTWFRDYLYIPIGGSRGSKLMQIRNVFVIFVVSGFWHGANWTFIVWGALNALYFIPLMIFNKNRKNIEIVAKGKLLPGLRDFVAILSTFFITVIAWIFFRAENINHAFVYIHDMFDKSIFSIPHFYKIYKYKAIFVLIVVFVIVEWMGRSHKYGLEFVKDIKSVYIRWFSYALIIFLIGFYMQTKETPFIYFQF